ncbi:glyoxalase [Corynebacterium canis]|uniref:Glyoxalase n=1 Tax=Corynebacterium canis TaxID=679663 RepID=A0A5C5US79_9CORY|nr:VOC family protein [Corynebacterium canis]TWT29066.1 glyoxalase [Corynebacterium canis]WJY75295.1 Glyoxalase-like domain protein [Corynebacterium canis]
MAVLEHVALFVSDLERAKEFYCRWFGGVANDQYHNPRTGLRTYFLTFEGGARLELMARPDVAGAAQPNQLGWAHIAFTVGTKRDVDTLAAAFRAAGFEIINGPRTTGDGYYEAVVLDPEGNQVEFVANPTTGSA